MENTAQPGNYAFAFHEAIVSYFKEVAPELPELLFEEFVDVVKFVVAGNLPTALVTLRNAIRSKHPMYVQDPWVEGDEEHNLFYGWLSNNDLKHKLTTYGSPPSYREASDIVTLIKVNIRPIREAIPEWRMRFGVCECLGTTEGFRCSRWLARGINWRKPKQTSWTMSWTRL